MRFSVLHLSDLHRGSSCDTQNEPLIESLRCDADRFAREQPETPRPSICVVSGDLVYGVAPSATEEDAQAQYDQALSFLVALADALFAGNHERLVVVPGNHDVSFPDVRGSAEHVGIPNDPAEKSLLVRELRAGNSHLRWSWQELCFYRIADPARYERRLAHFARLYDAFYAGARTFALAPSEQYAVFDYPDLKFTVLGLSSCYRNDPWRRIGAFHPVALSKALAALREPSRIGMLAAAVWHHCLTGGPEQDDYLDMGPLQTLIDEGVSMCFHGHGHFPELADQQLHLGSQSRGIKIIGASTLSSGPADLQPGVPRSYNVVEVDTSSWTGRIHLRQMTNADFDLPVWGPGYFTSAGAACVGFSLSKPLHERPAMLDAHLALEKADSLLGQRRWADAVDILKDLRHVPDARPFLTQALGELRDPRRTIEVLWPPLGVADAVLVGGAILEAGTSAEARDFLSLGRLSASPDASVREILRRVRERRWQ